ncbi:cation:proton antiporter [Labilithrix luteola]|uniref:cation:proton antiporter n=1 Tax=Labilithrix luteola TaxID=1391654 RepID=UPI0023DDCCCE|nr:cation:proton antiporter [Labilithrix luteola]
MATVLLVAAVTTVLFQRLRQPVVLGYMIAGMVIGPYVPIPLVADPDIIHTLSELGVILLMFSLGLEFSLHKLVEVGPAAGITAVVQSSLMLCLGFEVARLFGWTTREAMFTGAIVAISSTTIIAKAFEEQRIGGSLREIVVGVLIVEDLIAILLMAALTAIGSGGAVSVRELGVTSLHLAIFLAALIVVGILVVPRAIRAIIAMNRPETTLVASIGLCFGVSLLARSFGYSVALGAFISGSLVAESGEQHAIEGLIRPVRDLFAAIFFVSVGMMLDPSILVDHWRAILVLTFIVIVGKVLGVGFGAFLTGHGVQTSIGAGLSLAQIGEFSFIIAGLGISLDATRNFLYPIAIAVSAITTLTTPWLIRAAKPVASFVDHKLPQPLQTFAALYGSWIDRLRSGSANKADRTAGTMIRKLLKQLVVDALLLGAVIVAAYVARPRIVKIEIERLGLPWEFANSIALAFSVLCALPFCIGIARVARRLGILLADLAFPGTATPEGLDLAAAPRRALIVTLQLACVLLVGIPLVTFTQPLLPGFQGALILLIALVLLGIMFWKTTTNLEGHVRAGAEIVAEALTAGTVTTDPGAEDARKKLDQLRSGLGTPVTVIVEGGSPADGHSLAELDLRGLTGATVLAISREDHAIVPSAKELLRQGDVLVVAGSREAVHAAKVLLEGAHGSPRERG